MIKSFNLAHKMRIYNIIQLEVAQIIYDGRVIMALCRTDEGFRGLVYSGNGISAINRSVIPLISLRY